MTKEKKQIVVLVSLVAVVGTVGAFQFLNKGPSAEVAAVVEEAPVVDAGPDIAVVKPTDLGLLFGGILEPRDPFIPQAIMLDDREDDRRLIVRPPIRQPDTQITGPVNPFPPDGPITGTGVRPGRPLGALSLVGVIIGPKPMAVFEGDTGRQVLVGEGRKLPNGAVLISIAEGKVIVRKNGKIQTIEFEEAYS